MNLLLTTEQVSSTKIRLFLKKDLSIRCKCDSKSSLRDDTTCFGGRWALSAFLVLGSLAMYDARY